MTRTVGGRYRLSEFLASGESGEVWRALDLGTARPVAVKLIYPHLAEDVRLRDRFLRSRGELTSLWHPSIARVLDIVVEDDELALITDLVPGMDLARRLAQSGPLPPAAAAAVAASVADALSAAHRVGVVHGDIKPSNVVVPPAEDGPARLTDFGVTILVRAGMRHEPHLHTRYRAPEVTDGAVPAPPSDVYAFGVVLAETIAGDPAQLYRLLEGPATDPVARLSRIAAACIRRDLGGRPSATEVFEELRELAPALAATPGNGHVAAIDHQPGRHAAARPPDPEQDRVRDPAGGTRRRSERMWLLRRPVRVFVALVGALAIVLGGLTATRAIWGLPGEAQTNGTEPRNTAGGSASAPGVTVPTTPAAKHTHAGGAEFVRYWFAALTHAQQTGDTKELAGTVSPSCENCQTALRTIRAAYRDGGSLRDGAYLVRLVSTNNLWSLDRPIYEATLDRNPRIAVNREGEAKQELPGLTFSVCVLILEWHDARWRVLEIGSGDCIA